MAETETRLRRRDREHNPIRSLDLLFPGTLAPLLGANVLGNFALWNIRSHIVNGSDFLILKSVAMKNLDRPYCDIF